MPKIIYDEANLNPTNNAEVAKVLKKSKNAQLWFLLDDCIPSKGKDIPIVVINSDIDDYKDELPFVPYCAYTIDRLFYMETTEELEEAGLDYMLPYMPLLKNCYIPYICIYSVPEDISKKDWKRLCELAKNKVIMASLEETKGSVKLNVEFLGCGKKIYLDVFVSEEK